MIVNEVLWFLHRLMRKLNRWGLDISFRFKTKRVRFLPVAIDLEPVNYCNLKCPHCQVTYFQKPKQRLNEASFKNILDQFPYLSSIKLQGMGEPYLNKDLPSLLAMGEARGVRMNVFSNATVITETILHQMRLLKHTWITFSVDGASPQVFHKMRPGSEFETILETLRKVGSEAVIRARLGIWTVVTKDNIHELTDIVRIAHRYSIPKVSFQLFLNDWAKTEVQQHIRNSALAPSNHNTHDSLLEARNEGKKLGVRVETEGVNKYSQNNKCDWPWKSAFIAVNGDVVPCCILSDADTVNMGNIFETPFRDIWKSKSYIDFRESIRKHRLRSYCRNCYESSSENPDATSSAKQRFDEITQQ